MTVVIPEWLLWALGIGVGIVVLVLAAFGAMALRSLRHWRGW